MKEAVDDIYKEVSSMNEMCVDMKQRLQATKSETRHLIHQTTTLQNQRSVPAVCFMCLYNVSSDGMSI